MYIELSVYGECIVEFCDVVIVGYGLIGFVVVLMFGCVGYCVIVFECWLMLYGLLCFMYIDGEIVWIVQVSVDVDYVLCNVKVVDIYYYCDVNGDLLFELNWIGCVCGYFVYILIYQFDIEDVIDVCVSMFCNVMILCGWEVDML